MGADYQPSAYRVFTYQAPIVLNQPNPVQNTWYDLPVITNFRLYDMGFTIMTANETCQAQAVMDGEAVQSYGGLAMNAGSVYYGGFYPDSNNMTDNIRITAAKDAKSFQAEGRSLLIRVRKTTALGAGNLRVVLRWGQLT